jgi:hypothetical protein
MKWRLRGFFKIELIIFEQYKHWAIKIAFDFFFQFSSMIFQFLKPIFFQEKMKIISN